METFSTRLARWRSLNGLTQQEAGDLLGVTDKYVGMLEREEKPVKQGGTLDLLLTKLEQRQRVNPWAGSEGLAEAPATYHAPSRGGLSVSELLEQVRADVEALAGDEASRARAYRFLRDLHLPMLGKLLNLEP